MSDKDFFDYDEGKDLEEAKKETEEKNVLIEEVKSGKKKINKKAVIIAGVTIIAGACIIGSLSRKDKKDNKVFEEVATVTKEPVNSEIFYDDFDVVVEDLKDYRYSYEKMLDAFVYSLNTMNYDYIDDMTYCISKVGDKSYWENIKGNVVSSKVIEGNSNKKLVRFTIDVEEPGSSSLKKGTNTKFCYFAREKYDDDCSKWVISPMFDKIGKLKDVKYEDSDDGILLEEWKESVNGGFGFRDESDYKLCKEKCTNNKDEEIEEDSEAKAEEKKEDNLEKDDKKETIAKEDNKEEKKEDKKETKQENKSSEKNNANDSKSNSNDICYYDMYSRSIVSTYDNDVRDFDTLYNRYFEGLKEWNYTECVSRLAEIYPHSASGNSTFWEDIKGTIDSVETVSETRDVKTFKIVFNIINPGKTKLKKGKNTRYVSMYESFTEYELNWYVTPLFEKESDAKINYEYGDKTKTVPLWKNVMNGGLGFANDEIKAIAGVNSSEKISIDLNNDSKKEDIIYLGEDGLHFTLYINKGKSNEVTYKYKNSGTKIYVVDIDSSDKYKEIVDSGFDDNNQPSDIVLRYDGKKITEISKPAGLLEFSDMKGDKEITMYDYVDTTTSTKVGKKLVLNGNKLEKK